MKRFSISRALGLAALIALGAAGVAYCLDPRSRFDLWKFDWQAAGAIATVLATAFTAAAAWAAYRAVGAAFAIDQRQADRTRDQRARSTIVMAYALDQELEVLAMLMANMSALSLPGPGGPDDRANELFTAFYNGTQMIRIPLLERFIDSYSDFDGLTAARLVKTLTGALEMRARPDSHKVHSFEAAREGIQALLAHAKNLHVECSHARARLEPYKNAIKKMDGAYRGPS